MPGGYYFGKGNGCGISGWYLSGSYAYSIVYGEEGEYAEIVPGMEPDSSEVDLDGIFYERISGINTEKSHQQSFWGNYQSFKASCQQRLRKTIQQLQTQLI